MPDKSGKRDQGRCKSATDDARTARERELVMKVTKEIVVKFVEMGKVSPASFEEVFSMVHRTVNTAMHNGS